MQRFDQVSPIPPLTRVVKTLVIACVTLFFANLILEHFKFNIYGYDLIRIFGLAPAAIIDRLWLWQFATYLFLHGNEMHLLLNMLILWYFGSEIEMRMGERGFWQYFFLCGIGAGLFNFAINIAFRDPSRWNSPMIGASGAIYGILVAYGIFFGSRYMLVFFLFPVQAKYFAMIMAGLEFIFSLKANPQDNVAHVAHLGGMIVGAVYLYFRYIRPSGTKKGGKKDHEREKLKRQFTLIVNQTPDNENKEDRGPYWN